MKPIYAPQFGSSPISGDASGIYQPIAEGRRAVVLGVADRTGALCDIVAWEPSDPYRWWVRTGVMPILGEGEVHRAECLDAPLYLFGTPHDWLFNHGSGGYWPAACIIDWSIDPRLIFGGVRIVAHSEAVARQLEAAQRRHDRPLIIQVASNEAERAAA